MANSKFWSASSSGSTIPIISKTTKQSSKTKKKIGIGLLIFFLLVAIVLGLGYYFVGRPALAIYSKANTLKSDISLVGEAFQNRDLVQLNEVLDKTEQDINDLRKDKDEKFSWAKNLKLFKVNEYYSDFDKFSNAGIYAVDAVREMSRVITPFADAAGLKVSPDQELPKAEGLMEAFQGWVSVMPQVANDMDGVIERVGKVGGSGFE